MPLEQYREKRDFTKTPEPSGKPAGPHRELSYVIQRHAASHLHWDFRIELDGVLISWAVPKGPSYDPAEKRLAMHVEDHPLEYGGFEGTIPKGQYGGGTVMLWDRGTWEPFVKDEHGPAKHLEEGHLKMVLHGERLNGRWVIVRTRGYGGGRDAWLLIKEHDGEERPHAEFDAVKEWTTSVSTGRTMEQIAEGHDAVWESDRPSTSAMSGPRAEIAEAVARREAVSASGNPKAESKALVPKGARRAAMPASIDVELATLVKEVPQGEHWIHEIKFDGYRIVALRDKKRVRLISRNGKDWTSRFPAIAKAVEGLAEEPFILDGEVVAVRPDGTTDFQALQNFARKGEERDLNYYVFDLLFRDGYDLRTSSLEARKEALARLVPPGGQDAVRYTDHIEGHGDAFYHRACEFSLEGVISKRAASTYRVGRQRDWVKTKCLLQQEFVVVGWTDPGGARQGFGALVLGVWEDGELRNAGRVGTGFSEATLRELHSRLSELATDTSPLADPPRGAMGRGVHWVRPELVAEVAFTEWTEEHQLRHPSFMGLREDKEAHEVGVEKPAEIDPSAASVAESTPTPEPAAETAGRAKSDAAEKPAGGGKKAPRKTKEAAEAPVIAGVRLSHPDRALWPEVPYTKQQLARYYEAVAEYMLPHVEGRPLSLVRCPNGHTGECFYQKTISNFPSAVKTVPIYVPDDDKMKPFGRVDGLGGIIGLVQMGVLEIHPWGSRVDDSDKPDRLIFDLDPDPELPFRQVAATALLLRQELEALGLTSWLKTTGGKGLHVMLPVERRYTWDEVRDFSHAFVDSIVRLEPRMFTANMSKAQRQGRIFIDYLRNARGATAVAAYSSRARPMVPVSVPLDWEEIEDVSERPFFSAEDAVRRINEPGFKDPWSDLPGHRQRMTAAARRRLGI